jgi:hypothetical protein
MYEYIRILLGARPILPISRLKVNQFVEKGLLICVGIAVSCLSKNLLFGLFQEFSNLTSFIVPLRIPFQILGSKPY